MRAKALTFKTIVVATDLEKEASSALRYAQAVAHQQGSKLVLMHGIDPASYAFPNGAPASLAADAVASAELKRMEDEARNQGIAIHSAVESGVVCERILQALADHHADLLVLGTRAKTIVGQVALGTVARKLLAKAHCPILAVSPEVDAYLAHAGRWQRVLVATDFSSASLAALRHANGSACEQLLVLHATRCGNEHACSNCLKRLRFLAPSNASHTVPVSHVVTAGGAAEAVARYAKELPADLIVLGSPENELSTEDLPSSTVLQVISRVSCPVLCIPSSGKPNSTELIREIAFA